MCNHEQCQQYRTCQYQGNDPLIPTLAMAHLSRIKQLESENQELRDQLAKALRIGDELTDNLQLSNYAAQAWIAFRERVK